MDSTQYTKKTYKLLFVLEVADCAIFKGSMENNILKKSYLATKRRFPSGLTPYCFV